MYDKVVYFSLHGNRKHFFYEKVKAEGICYCPKFSFGLEGKDESWADPRDLIPLINRQRSRETLHIIIDYISFFGAGDAYAYARVVRDLIMAYPEVQFLFDETIVKQQNEEDETNYNFLNFLFFDGIGKSWEAIVHADMHTFNWREKNEFICLLKGRNNIYDASNLRYAIRKYKFDNDLHVSHNFKKLEDSRQKNAAVVVEEEYHQNMFNSYCLYANGYRVYPIVTGIELLWINKKIKGMEESPLLVRDYDLQFIDEDKLENPPKKGYNKVDLIRGAKKEEGKYELLLKDNTYWDNFKDINTFFISKGDESEKVSVNLIYQEPMGVSEDNKELRLRGIKKPIEGIYSSIQSVGNVKVTYSKSRDREPYKTRREDGNHSCPLNIYGIARAMVHRAEDYYQNGRYRLAAVVAGEALLVLNGFHRSLMCKAYYIQAVAENAMAMSLLGGREKMLKEDINIRLGDKVKQEVERMINSSDRKNLLYNIYNDCILFCQDKEYFNAADEALNVMVQVKEGADIYEWYQKVKNLLRRKRILFIRQYKKVKTWWSNPISCNHKKNQT